MDEVVRFRNPNKGMANAAQILSMFENGIKDLETNTIQISSDGPNAILQFLERFSEIKEFDKHPPLVNIGACGQDTFHVSINDGINQSGWNIGKILKVRRELFEKVTETELYPLPHCGHRWCENEFCSPC